MTTGELQQRVFLHGERVGERALVVGAEHVSFSAVLTLAHAGARVVGMTTELPRHQSFAVARAGIALRHRTPVFTLTRLQAIHGRERVEEVELLDLDSGNPRRVACDLVVFTGDWIPDHELAVMAGLTLDRGTRGPRVDTGLRTDREGVFAAGNLLHGAEPADVAALGGRSVAGSVTQWLTDGSWPHAPQVPIVCEAPLQWIAPNAVSAMPDPPPRNRFVLRSTGFIRRAEIRITQRGRVLWGGRVTRLVPGRSTSIPADWVRSADLTEDEITVWLAPR